VQADYDEREKYLQSKIGWFASPVTTGEYPASVQDTFPSSLPSFTDEEKAALMGSYDFFAVDHHTTYYVSLKIVKHTSFILYLE